MLPAASKEALTARLSAKGLDLQHLALAQGVSEMLEFFREAGAEGCTLPDGDMLLFQWGTYDSGPGPHFEVDITRQFIAADAEGDDAISQLHLTYKFTISTTLAGCGAGTAGATALPTSRALRRTSRTTRHCAPARTWNQWRLL